MIERSAMEDANEPERFNKVVNCKHQDSFLGPQQAYLSSYLHYALEDDRHWAVHFSIGMAIDDQKRHIFHELAAAGNRLNEDYFLGVENLELWVDGQLGGLCRFSVCGDDDHDEFDELRVTPNAKSPYKIYIGLQAVFVRPQLKSRGFGEALCHQLSDVVTSGLLNRLLPQDVPSPSFNITLSADFESAEGERFYNELAQLLQMKLTVLEKTKGIPFRIIEDAGY